MQPATAIALLDAIESLLSAVVADGLADDRHDSNTELIAQGISNLVCPFFGGRPATGAIARTSANINNGAKSPENVLVYRIFGPFLFGAAEKMSDAQERVDQLPRVLILRLHLVTAMDATALNTLESIIERFQHHGSTVILSGLHRQPLDMLRKAGFIEVIGRENLCAHFDAALSRAKALLELSDRQ